MERDSKPVPLSVLAERVEHLREAATKHEDNDLIRHGEVMDEIREIRKAGAVRGDMMLKAMHAQSQMVLRSAWFIVGLLIVGLLGVVGVNVGLDLEGLGKVNVLPAASAEPISPPAPPAPAETIEGSEEH